MAEYKEFRIEALRDGKAYEVQVKGWLFWKSGYVYTGYFSLHYKTKGEALSAVDGYKNRVYYVD